MDRLQAEAVIERALELDAQSGETDWFDRATLQRLADELGVSVSSLNQAIDEVVAAPSGPFTVSAVRTIDAPASDLEGAIDSMLRLRGLTTDEGSVWRQATGWWPDLFRSFSVTTIAVALIAAGAGTTVRFVARLDRVWRAHVMAALLAPLLLLVATPGVVAWLALSATAMAASGAGYAYRREAIRRRLAQALGELARPDYRRHPW